MMILLIALIPAVVVFFVAVGTESYFKTTVAALIAVAIGVFTGNPAYAVLDVICVVIAYALAGWTMPKKVTPAALAPPKHSANQAGAGSSVGSYFVVAIAVAGGGLWLMDMTQLPPKSTAVSQPASYSSQAQTQTPQELYGEAVRKIEQRHPELNPDSPGYRQDLEKEALTRMTGYVKLGYAKHDALLMAVAEMESAATPTPSTWRPPTQQNISPPKLQRYGAQSDAKRPEKRPCVYKDVMADADYIACGLRPPQP